jgi:predicted HAD superfamily Cof-like phosphohydrolase
MKNLKEFHDTFADKQRNDSLDDKFQRRAYLIREEYEEVSDALLHLKNTYFGMTSSTMAEATEELVKELADLLYVIYGTAEELGFDLETSFNRVHKSNMSKLWEDGTVHYNEFGKVLKPPTYRPPNLRDLI